MPTAGENSGEETGDDASADRRLFGEERPTVVGFVASEMGVLRVELSADRIGGFGLVEHSGATDIATDGQAVVVATDEDVLIDGDATGEFAPLEFGPATAVGLDDGTVIAASPKGRLSETAAEKTDDAPAWGELGEVSGPNRFDGPLLATDGGVVRVGDDLENLGLRGVADVAHVAVDGQTALLAGTGDGLYRREGERWVQVLEKGIGRVTADGDGWFAVTVEGHVLRGDALVPSDGEGWERVALPDGHDAFDVKVQGSLYVVTDEGEVLIGAEPSATSDGFEGWRSQPLGVRGVRGFVLLEG